MTNDDTTNPSYVLGAVLAQLEDLSIEDQLQVLHLALAAIETSEGAVVTTVIDFLVNELGEYRPNAECYLTELGIDPDMDLEELKRRMQPNEMSLNEDGTCPLCGSDLITYLDECYAECCDCGWSGSPIQSEGKAVFHIQEVNGFYTVILTEDGEVKGGDHHWLYKAKAEKALAIYNEDPSKHGLTPTQLGLE